MLVNVEDKPMRLKLIPLYADTLLHLFLDADGKHVFEVSALPPDTYAIRFVLPEQEPEKKGKEKICYLLVQSWMFDEVQPTQEIPEFILRIACSKVIDEDSGMESSGTFD